MVFEASQKHPYLESKPWRGSIACPQSHTQVVAETVRAQASWLELRDWCHYATRPYFSQRAPFISEITTSLKCLTFFRGSTVINIEKGHQKCPLLIIIWYISFFLLWLQTLKSGLYRFPQSVRYIGRTDNSQHLLSTYCVLCELSFDSCPCF